MDDDLKRLLKSLDEKSSGLFMATAQTYELYKSFMEAGFNSQQAMELVKMIIASSLGGK